VTVTGTDTSPPAATKGRHRHHARLSDADPDATLLDVRDLKVEFRTRYGVSHAVNGVSFSVRSGETLAILGESGCGKSVTAQAVMGIVDSPPGFVTGGQVLYRGVDLLKVSTEERRKARANHIAMIFQDALSALNPVFTVGFQLAELFRVHRGMSRADGRRKAIELLDLVKIPGARQRVGDFPHQFSGGMRQRVMIAMALALDPDVLIADEPTTALDVTVQAQVMNLLAGLQRERNMGLILITHDMGVVADVADRIAVMYAGRMVERAAVHDIYARPAHPYTKALLESIPRVDQKGQQLRVIKGLPPALTNLPPGCNFAPRCRFVRDRCREQLPPLYPVTPGGGSHDTPAPVDPGGAARGSACHYWEEVIAT
jgi:oligopeptide transport system ATP-binding protein